MPRLCPGQYPAHPFPNSAHGGLALARPFGMNIANPRFPVSPSSQYPRSFYENPYDSGNENRRRNKRGILGDMRARMQRQSTTRAGFGPIGGMGMMGMGGPWAGYQGGMYNRPPGLNPFQAGMYQPHMEARTPRPRMPFVHNRAHVPRVAPYGRGPYRSPFARQPRQPYYRRGYPPRPVQRPAYASSFIDDEDDDDDDDFEFLNRRRFGRGLSSYDNSSDDDDDDDLEFTRRLGRYGLGPRRRYDDLDDEDEDDFDDLGDDGLESPYTRYGTYRPYHNY